MGSAGGHLLSQVPLGLRHLLALPGRRSELFARVGHQMLKLLAGDCPGVLLQGNSTMAFALAGVLARIAAAAALSFAVVFAIARMLLDNSAGALPCTRILFAFPFATTSIESATNVRLLKKQSRIDKKLRLLFPFLRGHHATTSRQQPTECGRGQFVKFTSLKIRRAHVNYLQSGCRKAQGKNVAPPSYRRNGVGSVSRFTFGSGRRLRRQNPRSKTCATGRSIIVAKTKPQRCQKNPRCHSLADGHQATRW